MSAKFVEYDGKFGQVEANRLTGITFGNIEAQAPAYESCVKDAEPIAELENGMFLCVVPDDTANGLAGADMGRVAVLPGAAPADAVPYLVYSEKKIYDERLGYADFVDRAKDKVDGLLFPKLIGLTPDSCVFTTNTIDEDHHTAAGDINLVVGEKLYVGDNGYLSKTSGTNEVFCFVVDKVYTMPDGEVGVKVQCKRFS